MGAKLPTTEEWLLPRHTLCAKSKVHTFFRILFLFITLPNLAMSQYFNCPGVLCPRAHYCMLIHYARLIIWKKLVQVKNTMIKIQL